MRDGSRHARGRDRVSRAGFDPSVDYYRLLGVSPSASMSELRAAYRRLAKAYHPDLHAGSTVAAARMARLNEAKAVLLHQTSRAAYDAARSQRYGAGTHRSANAGRTSYTRQAPIIRPRPATAPPPPPPASTSSGGWLDRQTLILLAMAFPFVSALLIYMYDAVQVAAQPPRHATSDLALAPVTRASPQRVAQAAYALVAGRAPNPTAGAAAYNVIRSLVDASPEASWLHAIGYRLYRAGYERNTEAWNEAVHDLCRLSDQC